MADSFNFELVSPERLLLSAQVTEVVIPATEGEMTVMAYHAPTMTTVKPGVVTVKMADGKTERFAVFGGFADILPTGCTLLAESAVHVDELDRSVLENRISEVRAELEGAVDEKKTRLEQFIAELTKLGEIVIPA